MKTCPRCKTSSAGFYKDRTSKDGLASYCKDCHKKQSLSDYHEHKVERGPAHKKSRLVNRAKILARNTKRRHAVRLEALRHYSSGMMVCACCEEPNLEFLCLDHINGGGSKHRKELKGTPIYMWLLKHKFPEGFRVLCFNCNFAVQGGKVCPHTYRTSARGGGILTGTAILQNIKMGRISIEPFQHEHLNPSSVDLTLGPTVVEYILKGELDARKPPKFRKYGIENSGIVLKPGRAYLMHTNEIVHTDHYVSVLDGKSSLGRLFISVHETAGYVDPGFKGQITLEVTVTHPVRVYAGMRFCQLRFYSMVGKPVLYGDTGHYLGELAMGAVPSLCHQQIKESGI